MRNLWRPGSALRRPQKDEIKEIIFHMAKIADGQADFLLEHGGCAKPVKRRRLEDEMQILTSTSTIISFLSTTLHLRQRQATGLSGAHAPPDQAMSRVVWPGCCLFLENSKFD